MSVIAIDIDSTLYDFAVPFRQAYLDLALEHGDKENYFRGAYQSWVEWRSPADVCGQEAFLEALERVHSPEVILQQQPFEGAAEVLQDLYADGSGHDLLYVSNRDPDAHDATHSWLHGNLFPTGPGCELICTMGPKLPLLNQCQYIIDDRPRTLVDFVYNFTWKHTHGSTNKDRQRKGFGLLYEYNRALTDIPNIYLAPTWSGLRYYLERKDILCPATTLRS